MGVATRSFVYAASLATYAYGIYFFAVHVRGHSPRPQASFGGEWKYLTILNLWLQIIYYSIALFRELLSIVVKPKSPTARYLRSAVDGLHASAAWPFGLFVAIAFWAIYAVDRELVYPQSLDKYIPQWLNHVMHTVHIPLLLVDKYVAFHRQPKQWSGIGAMFGLSVLYLSWVLYLAIYRDIWVYPILEVLPWSLRIVGFVLAWFLMMAFYKMGQAITMSFWGVDAEASVTKSKAKIK